MVVTCFRKAKSSSLVANGPAIWGGSRFAGQVVPTDTSSGHDPDPLATKLSRRPHTRLMSSGGVSLPACRRQPGSVCCAPTSRAGRGCTFCRPCTNFIEHYACRGTSLIGAISLSQYSILIYILR